MKKRIATMLFLTLTVCWTIACAPQGGNDSIVPFSQIGLSASIDDMIAIEGESSETYDSLYGGTAHTYSREYLGHEGTVKYIYDSSGSLTSIAWACEIDSPEALNNLFERAQSEYTRQFGEKTEQNSANILGAVWKKDGFTIVISAASFADANVMQIAFMDEKGNP